LDGRSSLMSIIATMTQIHVGDIHIIESLGAGFAKRTGWVLHEELKFLIDGSPSRAIRSVMRVHYDRVESRHEFFRRLLVIADEARREHRAPILHFETHGSEDGLHLENGDLIPWHDLKPALTEINEIANLNVIVLVAACVGLDMTKTLAPVDRAPFRLIIGPNRDICARDIQSATRAFYATLFQRRHATTAYNAMNEALGTPSPGRARAFYAFTAEELFAETMRTYFAECQRDGDTDTRVDRVVADVVATKWNERGIGTSAIERQHLREAVRAQLTNHREYFERSWRQFFFVDRYPENAERFPIRFEECWNDRSVD
jgi:hypothetical protein